MIPPLPLLLLQERYRKCARPPLDAPQAGARKLGGCSLSGKGGKSGKSCMQMKVQDLCLGASRRGGDMTDTPCRHMEERSAPGVTGLCEHPAEHTTTPPSILFLYAGDSMGCVESMARAKVQGLGASVRP